jgi:nucleoside-diphosphate-sugar epimerase
MTTGEDLTTRTFTSASWLPLTIDDARKAQHPYISYCVAKAEAEKAIWSFVSSSRPQFSISVLLPALIFGPPIQALTSLKQLNYSSNVFYSLFNGSADVIPPTSFGSYIDVRDLAAAHINSLTTPSVANARFLIGGTPYASLLPVRVLRALPEFSSPAMAARLPRDPDVPEVVTRVNMGDVESWNEKLGLQGKLRTPEETFGDAARKILELEAKLGKQ